MKTMKTKSSPSMPSSEKDGIVGRGKMAGGEKIKEFIATDESKC